MELNKSGVLFNAKDHTYTYKDKELQGITSTILKWLFPDTYTGIPKDVLDRAAEYGSMIHEAIEMYETLGDQDIDAVKECYKLLGEQGLEVARHEYTVSDHTDFASQIDLVTETADGDIYLGDIKTTSKLHTPVVTAQLAIYSYLFEMQNPSLTVKGTFALWLPKKQYGVPELRMLSNPIDSVKMKGMLEAFLAGDDAKQWREIFAPNEALNLPMPVQNVMEELDVVVTMEKNYEERKKELVDALQKAMQEYDIKKIENDEYGITITRVPETKRQTLDGKKLKEEMPDVYSKYTKESTVKECIKITRR